MPVLLQGVVGSTAYGLAREGSDVDMLGIFQYRTRELLRFNPPAETIVMHAPSDVASHEVGKFIRLALKCNPTIIELLWLDEYTDMNFAGRDLVDMRGVFLSEKYVRASYLGYANAQIKKMLDRGMSDPRGPKHTRHCFRLLRQGHELLTTGQLTIMVPDPEFYWQFDTLDADAVLSMFRAESAKVADAKSALLAEPHTAVLEDWYLQLRKDNW